MVYKFQIYADGVQTYIISLNFLLNSKCIFDNFHLYFQRASQTQYTYLTWNFSFILYPKAYSLKEFFTLLI